MNKLEKEIMGLLPKTKDGVAKIPNCSHSEHGRAWYFWDDVYFQGEVFTDENGLCKVALPGRSYTPSICECYSTKEALMKDLYSRRTLLYEIPTKGYFKYSMDDNYVFMLLDYGRCISVLNLITSEITLADGDWFVIPVEIDSINVYRK
jgi:hypothetical protein